MPGITGAVIALSLAKASGKIGARNAEDSVSARNPQDENSRASACAPYTTAGSKGLPFRAQEWASFTPMKMRWRPVNRGIAGCQWQ